jgi:hypothetical protein
MTRGSNVSVQLLAATWRKEGRTAIAPKMKDASLARLIAGRAEGRAESVDIGG